MENDGHIYICRCQEVTKKEIQDAIQDGAHSLNGIKVRTEAMMGLCQGRTCSRLIEKILSQHTEPANLKPSKRPPVRVLKIGDVTGDSN